MEHGYRRRCRRYAAPWCAMPTAYAHQSRSMERLYFSSRYGARLCAKRRVTTRLYMRIRLAGAAIAMRYAAPRCATTH